MATGTATITATATSAVTLSNPVSLDELQQLGTPTININGTVDVTGLMGLEEGLYVIVEPTTSDTDNGTALLAAYTTAKALTGLTATNRATVIVPPGTYDMGASALTLDTQYVDILGMGDNPRMIILKNTATAPITLNSTDVNVSGIWCYGSLAVTSSDSTNYFTDCILGVSGGAAALVSGDALTAHCNRVLFNNIGRSTNFNSVGGFFELCEFEGSNSLYVLASTQMRYCTVEVLLTKDAGAPINCKIYHCALKSAIGPNITNDIGAPYNVVDADVSV